MQNRVRFHHIPFDDVEGDLDTVCCTAAPSMSLTRKTKTRVSVMIEFSYKSDDRYVLFCLHSFQSFEIFGTIISIYLLGRHISKET